MSGRQCRVVVTPKGEYIGQKVQGDMNKCWGSVNARGHRCFCCVFCVDFVLGMVSKQMVSGVT